MPDYQHYQYRTILFLGQLLSFVQSKSMKDAVVAVTAIAQKLDSLCITWRRILLEQTQSC